jgi:small subunit ribosomal protein S4
MGDPKRPRRKYTTPRYPWSKAQLDAELKLVGEFGLRNKRELRRHQMTLSGYWTRARELLALPEEERQKPQHELVSKLESYGLVPEGANLDNVLDLKIENILGRRLQTYVFRTNLSKTSQQARQLISHGHISVRGRKVTSPSYLVRHDEDQNISYAPSSRYSVDDSDIRGPTEQGPQASRVPQESPGPEVPQESPGPEVPQAGVGE